MEEQKERKIVVTDGAGLVGSHLVALLLERGYMNLTVLLEEEKQGGRLQRVLARKGLTERFGQLNIAAGELDDMAFLQEQCAGASVIFHTAERLSLNDRSTWRHIRRNTLMTHCVVQAAADEHARLIFVSTALTLGEDSDAAPIGEESRPERLQGRHPFAVGTFYAENEVWQAVETGLEAVVLHPAFIVGVDGEGRSASYRIFEKVRRGVKWYSTGSTGYVGIWDVVRAMELVSRTEEAAGKRFVLSAENLTYKDFMTKTALAMNRRPPLRKLDDRLVGALMRFGTFLSRMRIVPAVPPQTLQLLSLRRRYDGSRIGNMFGFHYTSVEEVIREQAVYFMNENKPHHGISGSL